MEIGIALIKLTRPDAWVKTFIPMLISSFIIYLHYYPADFTIITNFIPRFLVGFFIVGPLLWGGCYVINDFFDAEFDRLHPTKCTRPIASGLISKSLAISFASLLIAIAFIFGFIFVKRLHVIMVGILVVHLIYCTPPFRVKNIPVLDIFFAGFLNIFLRFIAGILLFTENLWAVKNILILGLSFSFLNSAAFIIYRLSDKFVNKNIPKSSVTLLTSKGVKIVSLSLLSISCLLFIYTCFLGPLDRAHLIFAIILVIILLKYLPILEKPTPKQVVTTTRVLYLSLFIIGTLFFLSLIFMK